MKPQPPWQRKFVGAISVLVGCVMFLLGASQIWTAFHYVNQEYLHIFHSDITRIVSSPSGFLLETGGLGFLFCTWGIFMYLIGEWSILWEIEIRNATESQRRARLN
ncbi:MAG: hypothetical protein HON53_06110 [Planctomycetaceae bacterium]|jgi:hypothetical protein|nr:hypothetical protein [Planctomycetaceae bacterium]MBT6154297.1 hypothetical protein [Planctomycetaceae bacterium]MBT6485597.1 hypothetical protein [Planctomycetaceae bacterium]MBT6493138.1 hypothetical protein [Planctomycetaceae bacterium]